MRRSILLFVGCVLLSLTSVNAQGKTWRAKSASPLSRSRQLVLVTTRDWDAVQGTLRRFERKNEKAEWHGVGDAIPVVVGRGGMGWGAGLNAQTGDRKSTRLNSSHRCNSYAVFCLKKNQLLISYFVGGH